MSDLSPPATFVLGSIANALKEPRDSDGRRKNVVRLDVVRVERGMMKPCRCFEPHYELDLNTRLVYCKDCGAIVDPFDALLGVSRGHERINQIVERMGRKQRRWKNTSPACALSKKLSGNIPGQAARLSPPARIAESISTSKTCSM